MSGISITADAASFRVVVFVLAGLIDLLLERWSVARVGGRGVLALGRGQRILRRRPLHETLDDSVDAAANTPADQEGALLGRDILSQFAVLSEDHRAVLLLVAIEGLPYVDVARILGIPIGTVMSRLSRAREQFRRQMDGELPALRRVK